RAFHALPELNNSRGMPVNAIYGFIRMLMKLLKDTRPSHIAVVFDSAKRTFRDDLSEDYKSNRPAAPNDLKVQIPFIHRAVDAFRITKIMHDGFEADDVIGTLATRAVKSGFVTTIVTSDKDFMQLVGPRLTLWNTMGDKRTGLREVRERFGVEPAALVDIQALTGDAIDNVKGVPGVGEKTASALIQKFGDTDHLLADLDAVAASGLRGGAKLAALLDEHRQQVELARKLVRIETEMPLDIEPEDLAWKGIDEPAVTDLMRELEFDSMLQEIRPSQGELPMSTSAETLVGREEIGPLLEQLATAKRISINLTGEAGAERLHLTAESGVHVVERELVREAAPLVSSE